MMGDSVEDETVCTHEPGQVVLVKLAGQPEAAGLSQICGAASV